VLDALACLERLQEFLLEPDLHPELAGKENLIQEDDNSDIIFRKASFSYGEGGSLVLQDINLDIPAGSLMMVAGTVASGKTNLLRSILGDLTVRGGTATEPHSRAYVPQVPWTALGTVRENILFGKPYEEAWYNQVVHACALEPDFKLMPDGDRTWIGERGGNLSGGQKQRIALARAAYSRAKLFVLDSPLSAVDMYTCQHIFKFCIQQIMLAGGGTVVLATHQTELFAFSDVLVVMKDGRQVFNGKYHFDGVKQYFPTLVDTPKTEESLPPAPEKLSKEQMTLVTNKAMPKLKPKLSLPLDSVLAGTSKKEFVQQKQNIYGWYFGKMGWGIFAISVSCYSFISHIILSSVVIELWN
jgi:ABC-type transport system involved in cytochrome bd biosynthesis fused ATPase/permease subunit